MQRRKAPVAAIALLVVLLTMILVMNGALGRLSSGQPEVLHQGEAGPEQQTPQDQTEAMKNAVKENVSKQQAEPKPIQPQVKMAPPKPGPSSSATSAQWYVDESPLKK